MTLQLIDGLSIQASLKLVQMDTLGSYKAA